MTITPEQKRAIRDGLRAVVEPAGGVVNEMVLDGIFSLAEAGNVEGRAKLRHILAALAPREQKGNES